MKQPCTLRTFILALFFASGFSGLVYEIVWTRLLSLVFGNSIYATATVLAGFMGGLAVGSLVFGGIADRTRHPLRLCGILELLVGAFALAFPSILRSIEPLYRWYANLSGASYQSVSFTQAILLAGVLVPPTVLMGGTLSLLTRQLTKQPQELQGNISLLYGLNTCGGMLGCAAATFILIASFGVRHTTWIAIAITFLTGLLFILAGRTAAPAPFEKESRRPAGPYSTWFIRVFLALLGLVGFTGMAYEVLWTRVLTFVTGSTTYSFTIMLATYLCGLALGAMIAGRIGDGKKPLSTLFGRIQALAGLSVLLTLIFTPTILKALNHILFKETALRFGDFTSFLALEFSLSILFILPVATLMGMTFPLAAALYADWRGKVGAGTGVGYFADTIGAIAGSLGAAYLLIPLFGTLNSLILLALLNLGIAFFIFCCREQGGREMRFSIPRFAILALLMFVTGVAAQNLISKDTFSGFFTQPGSRQTYIDEDAGGTVTVEDYGDHRTISINGINVAGTGLKFETTQKLQAHLALLLHPHPQQVLQIGFGSGGTAWAISRHPVITIDCVEINRAIIHANTEFKESNHGVLKDARVHVYLDDARSYLVKTDRMYDAILSDSIHPRQAGNGGLYSADYFRLCRQHLNPDGIFSSWLPFYGLSLNDFRVATRSLQAVFPNVYLFHCPMGRTEWTIILGTLSPLRVDPAVLRQKLNVPEVAADLQVIKVNRVEDLLASFLIGDRRMKEFLGSGKTLNTDDSPYLEYVAPRSSIANSREALLAPIYQEFINCREDVSSYLEGGDPGLRKSIEQAFRSSDAVLSARLVEMTAATDHPKIIGLLDEALRLDPSNNVARNLLEAYAAEIKR